MKWQVINKNCEKQGAEYTALGDPRKCVKGNVNQPNDFKNFTRITL